MGDEQSQEKTVIDWELCVKLTDNNPKLAKDILLMLHKQLQQEQPRLETALKSQDLATLREINHSILGAVSYTGVPQLHAASLALNEYLKDSDDPADIEKYAQQIIAAIKNLIAAISKDIAS